MTVIVEKEPFSWNIMVLTPFQTEVIAKNNHCTNVHFVPIQNSHSPHFP